MAVTTAPVAKKHWWLPLVEGILAILVGIFFLTRPLVTSSAFVLVLGFYWLFLGIADLFGLFRDRTAWGWKLFSGIIGILAGGWIISGILIQGNPLGTVFAVGSAFTWVLGFLAIMYGIMGLIGAFRGGGWVSGILGIVTIFFGIILLSNPIQAALGLPVTLGILLIFGGIFLIIAAFRMRSA